MLIAIPMDGLKRIYHYNPCSSSHFGIYEILGNRKDIRYRYIEIRLNPWKKHNGEMVNNPKMKSCQCESTALTDPHHISEHYALLEAIGKCDYLVADQYCLNTLTAMKNVNIKIHKIPPFVKTPEEAINHFVIGTEIAAHIQYIHPVA